MRLNDRGYLREGRRNAVESYRALLAEYVELRSAGMERDRTRVKRCILRHPHPTVWAEMKRQRGHHDSLATLFHAAPEALEF